MCGIAGLIDFDRKSSLEILQKSTDSMAHRGPDGNGFEFIEQEQFQLGLGHRRLSIIDLSAAASQPMWYKDYCIIFNGEVYNYAEICSELQQLGHQFKSHSDTEMILHAWEEWGHQMIHKFIGMFVFVIYDAQKRKLIIYRDRAGVKPFVYYWNNELFLFGSEMKALLAHPHFPREINTDAVAAYLQFGYVPTPHSIFKNTQKLKPGHYLEFDLIAKSIHTVQYWNVYDAYNKPELKIDFVQAVEETERLLSNAFQYRMVSDVPVGVFLSGGYDSSCVTALLQKNNTEKIKTFSIGFKDSALDEAPYAKAVAAHLGTDHTEYYCTQEDALNLIPDLPFYYDEPFADSSAIPTTLVSRLAKEKVTVALSADAGDEVFAGYNRYEQLIKYGNLLNKIPGGVRKITGALMDAVPASSIPVLNKKYMFPQRYEKIKSFFKDPAGDNLMLNAARFMNEKEINNFLKQPWNQLSTSFSSKELKPAYYSVLHSMMAVDYQTYLVDDVLQKVDRAGMSVSLEGREPFLDQRIIEWAARLPQQYKYNNGVKKFILKEIVHKHIPAKMMDRPKMGFAIPLAQWLMNDLKPLVNEFLADNLLQQQGIFNREAISKLKTEFYGGKVERSEKLWFILCFQMWYARWMQQA